MKKHRLFQFLLLSAVASGSSFLSSCSTEEGIDLNDIDDKIGIQLTEFALPGNNSTHEIVLQELFDIDTTGCIKINEKTGEYYFIKEGKEVDPTNVKVNAVSITSNASDIHPSDFVIPIEKLKPSLPSLARRAPQEWPLSHTIQTFDITEDDITGDIKELYDTYISEDHKVKLNLTINFSTDLRAAVTRFSGLAFELPEFIELANVTPVNGTQVSTEDNTLEFENVYPNQNGGKFNLTADIKKLDFRKATDETQPDYLIHKRTQNDDGTYTGQIRMVGEVKIWANYDQQNVDVSVENVGANPDFRITSELTFDEIVIGSGDGLFAPDVDLDDIGGIDIGNDVPDFLNDPEVTLNLDNPILTLNVSSDLGVDGLINGKLTSHFKSETGWADRTLNIDGIRVKSLPAGSTDEKIVSKILVCAYNPNTSVYNTANGWQVIAKGDNLRKMLEKIPERIDFTADAGTDENKQGTIVLDHDYTLQPNYQFEAPLALNAGTTIVYNDSITGWVEDLEDIDFGSDTKIKIEADVVNNSPLELELTVTPVGEPGTDKAQEDTRKVLTQDVEIAVSTGKGANKRSITSVETGGKESKLTITLSQKKDGGFKKLDGIKLKAKALPQGTGKTLNSGTGTDKATQTIQMKNITVVATGTFEVNGDDD